MDGNYIFHVHSWRCGHAENVNDEEYIKKAISLGASSIYFTDHSPFPGDPFRSRMRFEQLNEYISTLKKLKDQYRDQISVFIGLEIEYLFSFKSYYDDLKAMDGLDLLLLGQHHSELSPGKYTFQLEDTTDKWKYLFDGQMFGILSGYFDAVAHPDRLFKDEFVWTDSMNRSSKDFICSVKNLSIPIEKNLASMRHDMKYRDEYCKMYREEFWNLVSDDCHVITGCDAHFLSELKVCG